MELTNTSTNTLSQKTATDITPNRGGGVYVPPEKGQQTAESDTVTISSEATEKLNQEQEDSATVRRGGGVYVPPEKGQK